MRLKFYRLNYPGCGNIDNRKPNFVTYTNNTLYNIYITYIYIYYRINIGSVFHIYIRDFLHFKP